MKYNDKTDVKKTCKPGNLISPPGARTDSSIALVWDKPEDCESITSYKIFMNGKPLGEVDRTDFTAENLVHGTEFSFKVCSVLDNGALSEESNEIAVSTLPKAQIFDITRYGAVGDGKTLNTAAIQKAIDDCSPGGCVYFPEGVFLSGALHLKSDMTLYVSQRATLLGSDRPDDYPLELYRYQGEEAICYSSLINGGIVSEGLKNVIITGGGRIDGNGVKLRYQEEEVDKKGYRGRVICFRNSENIYLYDLTVAQPPAWCIQFIYCKDISVNRLKLYILADENGNVYEGIHNGDGIDPDSSSNIYIFNTMIAGQDNCIAIKSGKDEEGRRVGIPSENIRITNCRFTSGGGIAIGSEMSGGVRNVLVRDCVFENNARVLGVIKAIRGRGNVVENIRYEDIKFDNTLGSIRQSPNKWNKGIICIDHFYSFDEFYSEVEQPFDVGTPVFKDIIFKNITIKGNSKFAVYMVALPESPLKNIRLENINATERYGLKAINIDGLELKNVCIKAREGEDYVFKNVNFK